MVNVILKIENYPMYVANLSLYMLHAGGGLALFGAQQTLILTVFTVSVSKNCETIAGKNACLIR